MSETRGAGREARGARIDAAIDRAAREMLDVEPPPGLRERVMGRLESPRRGIAWGGLAAPVAAAAIIVVAVMAPWRDDATPVVVPSPVVAQREGPRVTPPDVAAPVVATSTPVPTSARTPKAAARNAARTEAPRPDRPVAAAAVAAVEDVNFTAIAALAGPQVIAIERLADPVPSSMRPIEPAPLEIRALEVTALPETPRERREE